MKHTLHLRRLLAVAVAAVLYVGMACTPLAVSADTKTDLESKLQQLEEQEKKIKSELSGASSELSASQQRKNLIDSQIDNVQQQIALLDNQLSGLNSQIAAKTADIAQAETDIAQKEADIQSTHDALSQRLNAIMKSGNVSVLQMLMDTDNYADYLLKSKVIQCVSRRDQQTIDTLEAALEDIQARKTALEQEKADIETRKASVQMLKSSSNSKKSQLDSLYAAAQTEVRNLQSSVSSYNAQLAANKKEQDETDAAITRLINSSNGNTSLYNGGMMFWPVPTVRVVSSTFGYRWGTMHRGIDISNGSVPIYGEKIIAAASGTVIYANSTSTWGGGYGYYCIVDHGYNAKGQKVSTLYAHCSAMLVRVGDKVVGGQTVLAKAGATGDVTGPHLHFEVRLDGISVNPLGTYVSPNVN